MFGEIMFILHMYIHLSLKSSSKVLWFCPALLSHVDVIGTCLNLLRFRSSCCQPVSFRNWCGACSADSAFSRQHRTSYNEQNQETATSAKPPAYCILLTSSKYKLYTANQKRPRYLFCCSFYKCQPISIIFGTQYTEIICNTRVIDFPTSPEYCCCTTLRNAWTTVAQTKNAQF